MKQISLTQGKFALVDDEDFEWLNQYKWHFNGYYAVRRFGKIKIRMHRVINKTPKGFETDHIDRNGLNNQKVNLRTATRSQNVRNTSLRKNNISGFKGISWDKRRQKWYVTIYSNSKKNWLGYHSTLQGARLARRCGETIYWMTPATS